ncbi:MAG: hypothetical protein R8L58_03935, partial [Mariprofundaceae bacterium]
LATDKLDDALSDTDTAEQEPLEASQQALDPEVDYVSEAEVYIRYGMNEEALQQLDMALRLQPGNVQAHIKKAEILLGKDDKKAFDETIAVATMALAATDLARFRSSVSELGGDVDELVPLAADEAPVVEEGTGRETLQIDDADIDDLDFELTDADDTQTNATRDDSSKQSEAAAEELDWLFDEAFDNDEVSADEVPVADVEVNATQHFNNLLGEFQAEEKAVPPVTEEPKPRLLDGEVNATQELDSLLQEFADDVSVEPDKAEAERAEAERAEAERAEAERAEAERAEAERAEAERAEAEKARLAVAAAAEKTRLAEEVELAGKEEESDIDMGATMRLDQLFGEFYDDEEDEDELIAFDEKVDLLDDAADKAPADVGHSVDFSDKAIDEEAGATMRLDQLLGEFDDDDDVISFDDDSELDASVFEVSEAGGPTVETAADIDHGATQELDSLLGEFSDDEDDQLAFNEESFELDASFFEPGKADLHDDMDAIDLDADHGATQELDTLLSEFADDETPIGSAAESDM